MRPTAPQRRARWELEEHSPRATLPCAHCEAERGDLYALPPAHRQEGVRSDVCFFCFLQMTHEFPSPESRLN